MSTPSVRSGWCVGRAVFEAVAVLDDATLFVSLAPLARRGRQRQSTQRSEPSTNWPMALGRPQPGHSRLDALAGLGVAAGRAVRGRGADRGAVLRGLEAVGLAPGLAAVPPPAANRVARGTGGGGGTSNGGSSISRPTPKNISLTSSGTAPYQLPIS